MIDKYAVQIGTAIGLMLILMPEISFGFQLDWDLERLENVGELVSRHIDEGKIPGCVVCIGDSDGIRFLEPYGNRQLEPEPQAMTADTVFDLASLTKPIATATAIMCLIEDGRLRLEDRVSEHLAEFTGQGKDRITVKQLLVHTGGLIPDNALSDYDSTAEIAWQKICKLNLRNPIGEKFSYTDVGFIVLAKLVERLSGENLNDFLLRRVFHPLEMEETRFLPDESLRKRAAPTEKRDGRWMRGTVHDPRAYRLGGIAGHAGLFSTASDLSRFARMLLGQGTLEKRPVLHPQTIQLMTKHYTVPGGIRGLGWDIRSPYSSNRSDLYSDQAFGHGGFTGTAIWIDPKLNLFVIVLSNRVHPNGKGRVNKLAARIGSVAVAAARNQSGKFISTAKVLTGIDVLQKNRFSLLKGKQVGLITNHTGTNRDGRSTIELLAQAKNVKLNKLFSPEHGIQGKLDQSKISDSVDADSGLKVVSLYGDHRQPQPQDLQDLDALVFDIQDIGTRFYTYISTMGLAMQAAAKADVEFVVLDRPNPIGGVVVSGPLADPDRLSFIAFHSIPVRHGMTMGELARMFQDELNLDLKLTVVPMEMWNRNMYWDQTGLTWINPSPNMRTPTQALLYPGIGLLETTNLSVGRGTDTPFEVIGAPWIDPQKLAARLNTTSSLPGVRFVPIRFKPSSSKFQFQECGGVRLQITNRQTYQSLFTGLQIAATLKAEYPEAWEFERYSRLLANQSAFEKLKAGSPAINLVKDAQIELDGFMNRRARYLLYE